jgi:hypothetical protein
VIFYGQHRKPVDFYPQRIRRTAFNFPLKPSKSTCVICEWSALSHFAAYVFLSLSAYCPCVLNQRSRRGIQEPLARRPFLGNSSLVISPFSIRSFRECIGLRKAGDEKRFQCDRSFIGSAIVLPLSRGRDRLASGPPHRSVLIRLLPRVHMTASRSLGYECSKPRPPLLAACRTRHKPCDSHRRECACGAFPLVDLLSSADSAANAYTPALFARFVGTMRPSDSPQTCMSTVRLLTFFDRPTPSRLGVCGASRFSRMEFPHMPRVSDSAVSKDRSRLTPALHVAFPVSRHGRHTEVVISELHTWPVRTLSTLHPRPLRCMTRSQNDALLLSCAALSSATLCRFIPAHP